MTKQKNKITPPDFKTTRTEQDIISVMIGWLHDHDCAVVVWTEDELKGLRPQDIECGMIEWGWDAIMMNAPQGEEEEEETP